MNPSWDEEFVFRVLPNEHKLVLQVFDENRLTRDDFLGMIELLLATIPKEAEGRVIPPKKYSLQPRSARSKVKGYLHVYAAFVSDPTESTPESESRNGNANANMSASAGPDGLPAFVPEPPSTTRHVISNNSAGSSR